jgi:hypothetical protein
MPRNAKAEFDDIIRAGGRAGISVLAFMRCSSFIIKHSSLYDSKQLLDLRKVQSELLFLSLSAIGVRVATLLPMVW